MGNRKSLEKLQIPWWYSLSSYRQMRNLTVPYHWLKQFALRIDIKRLLDRIANDVESSKAREDNIGMEHSEIVEVFIEWQQIQELFSILSANPIFDDWQRFKEFREHNPNISFQTLDAISDGYTPVWDMTLRDFYFAECFIHPDKRHWCRKYFEQVEEAAPFPGSELADLRTDEYLRTERELRGHLMNEVLSKRCAELLESLSFQMRINPPYIEHEDPLVYGQSMWFMDEYVTWDTPEESHEYFVVDTSVPYKEAERAFKRLYEQSRKRGGNNKQINDAAFAKWCDDGVLPYVDLKMYEAIEIIRSGNPRLAFTEQELAVAIYEELPGRPPRDSSSVSDVTKPIADSLMNPDGGHYRLLLIEQTRREHQKQREE